MRWIEVVVVCISLFACATATCLNGDVSYTFNNDLECDNALNWNHAHASLSITQPVTVGTPYTVMQLTSGATGAHGYGAHLELAGNPGGGATIFRTDGGHQNSWIQMCGGNATCATGGQIYANGNNVNSQHGPPGSVQIASGHVNSAIQFMDGAHDYTVMMSINTNGGTGLVNIPSLAASSMVVTDNNQNLATIPRTAANIHYRASTPTNWKAAPPITVQAALDRLAALVTGA